MYKAIVCKLDEVNDHPNADFIAIGVVRGHNVIIGKDQKKGDLGIFFSPEGQLSEEFCEFHDLCARHDPETGKKVGGGFFDKNRRVRAQSFRGVKSEGFWMPVQQLNDYYSTTFSEGYTFEGTADKYAAYNDKPLCKKYETPATIRARANKARTDIEQHIIGFLKHVDTAQLRLEWDSIPDGSLLTITEKLHGTSHRVGHVIVKIDLSWWQRAINKITSILGYTIFKTERWQIVHGTRNTIVDKNSKGYYGSEAWRIDTIGDLDLNRGEVIYGELVGYTPNDKSIMNEQDTLPELRSEYPEKMVYSYGCTPEQAEFYVYRITQDGKDLSDEDLLQRCDDLGLSAVPYINILMLSDDNKQSVREYLNAVTAGSSMLCDDHIREGIVVRVTTPDRITYFLKNKSYEFGRMEGYIKDKSEYVDREEIA